MNKNTKLVHESLFSRKFSGKSDSDNSSVYNTNIISEFRSFAESLIKSENVYSVDDLFYPGLSTDVAKGYGRDPEKAWFEYNTLNGAKAMKSFLDSKGIDYKQSPRPFDDPNTTRGLIFFWMPEELNGVNESDWFPKSDEVGIQYLAQVGVTKNNSGLKPEVFNLLADMAGEIIALKMRKKHI